jgi:PTH1 family peptidyl-tRNA hydrolase
MEQIAIVGLGNFGDKYLLTRHNVGFIIVDFLASYYGFSDYKDQFKALVCAKPIADKKVFLIKPQTYMNLSGEAVQAFASFYKMPPTDFIIIQDDVDMDFGKCRYKTMSGDGGHNGIKDIQNRIGKNIHRLKIGIGRPEGRQETSDFVLGKFSKDELFHIETLAGLIAKNLEFLIKKDFTKFINEISKS